MEERLRILLCEDDENLGMLLREYLQAKGYAADLFSDGESGYKAFLKGKYDLCVLDVMMPKRRIHACTRNPYGKRRSSHHILDSEIFERRYSRRIQNRSRRLHYQTIQYGRIGIPYRSHFTSCKR